MNPIGTLVLAAVLGLAQAAAPTPPCAGESPRPVVENTIVSRRHPALRIQVSEPLRYVGAFRFVLKGVACVERHVFAAADSGRIQKMFIAQFENILEGTSGSYRWEVINPVRLGVTDYQHNVWFYDNDRMIRERPDAEAAATRRFLASKGLTLDSEVMMARFATVVGDAKRHELILFYTEPLAVTGHRVADFPDGAPATAAQRKLAAQLKERAMRAFTVIP